MWILFGDVRTHAHNLCASVLELITSVDIWTSIHPLLFLLVTNLPSVAPESPWLCVKKEQDLEDLCLLGLVLFQMEAWTKLTKSPWQDESSFISSQTHIWPVNAVVRRNKTRQCPWCAACIGNMTHALAPCFTPPYSWAVPLLPAQLYCRAPHSSESRSCFVSSMAAVWAVEQKRCQGVLQKEIPVLTYYLKMHQLARS